MRSSQFSIEMGPVQRHRKGVETDATVLGVGVQMNVSWRSWPLHCLSVSMLAAKDCDRVKRMSCRHVQEQCNGSRQTNGRR
jgi:hypothetical protein